MATATREPVEIVSPEGRSIVLQRDSLGISAVFFCIATAAAPMTAMLFNVPVIVSGAGWAVPAAFIVALVMLLVFSVGYVEMARRVTSAGGFYSFVSHGFGQTLGLGTASVITFSYTILTASIVGIFAYFAKTTISDWTGANIPLIVLLLGAVIVCLLFAYFDIKMTARILGVFFVAEVGVLLIFAIAVLVQGGAHGLTAAPLNPLNLLKNKGAIAVFGAAAPGIALFGAFWSWVGFEMAPNYGEESRQPRRIFSRATFGSLFALGFIYVLVSYAFTIGWGTGHTAQGVKAQFGGSTISAFYPLTGRYFGASLTAPWRSSTRLRDTCSRSDESASSPACSAAPTPSTRHRMRPVRPSQPRSGSGSSCSTPLTRPPAPHCSSSPPGRRSSACSDCCWCRH
jgi:amino acid transporter